jgi:hypothetical protein
LMEALAVTGVTSRPRTGPGERSAAGRPVTLHKRRAPMMSTVRPTCERVPRRCPFGCERSSPLSGSSPCTTGQSSTTSRSYAVASTATGCA